MTGNGWGGARNRKDRFSESIKLAQCEKILETVRVALGLNMPFNRMLTIHWEKLGVAPADGLAVLTAFNSLARDWARKRGHPIAYTQPHYGGKRWWMTCPYKGIRVGKLYKPNGGDRFASRQAWRLGYHSQRIAHRDRAFEKLFRLQKKLGSPTGVESPLYRPKGMWQRTFDKHLERYWELDDECNAEMVLMMNRLGVFRDRMSK